MRPRPDAFLERHRLKGGPLPSDASYGNNGCFLVECPATKRTLRIVASDGQGWDHVSVSHNENLSITPTWEEMCWVKDLFWGPEECVIQYHPARSQYRNLHPGCLHLWKPQDVELPKPNPIFVAPITREEDALKTLFGGGILTDEQADAIAKAAIESHVRGEDYERYTFGEPPHEA